MRSASEFCVATKNTIMPPPCIVCANQLTYIQCTNYLELVWQRLTWINLNQLSAIHVLGSASTHNTASEIVETIKRSMQRKRSIRYNEKLTFIPLFQFPAGLLRQAHSSENALASLLTPQQRLTTTQRNGSPTTCLSHCILGQHVEHFNTALWDCKKLWTQHRR